MSYWFYKGLARLPLSSLYALSSAAAWLIAHVFRYRLDVVQSNLARAFPDLPEQTRAALALSFYRHFTDTTVEIIAGHKLPMATLRERMVIANPELLDDMSNHYQQSVIVMTLHQGNWEWMLYAANDRFPMASAAVYKRLHNAGADRFSLESRRRFGAAPIEMRSAARDIVKQRRTPRLIFMVADQSPGKRERVHWTPFLNQPTAFFSGAAALARLTGFPVAFASCERTARGYYRIQLEEITRDPKSLSEEDIIERYARLAEAAIQRSPAAWLWSNRRWKHPPAQAVAETGAD